MVLWHKSVTGGDTIEPVFPQKDLPGHVPGGFFCLFQFMSNAQSTEST